MRQAEFPTDLIVQNNPLPVEIWKIVTILGVPRCDKSSKMEIIVYKLLNDSVALWVGFDDERLVRMTSDELNLIIEAYREMYP